MAKLLGSVPLGRLRHGLQPPDLARGPAPDTAGPIEGQRALQVAADARLDGLGSRGRSGSAAETRIRTAIQTWGVDAIDDLIGDFAFAAWSEDALILGRDAMSMRPLYYRLENGAVRFASRIPDLRSPDGLPQIHLPAVAAFLTGAPLPADRSFYEGIHRVPPGAALRFGPRGREEIRFRRPEAADSAPDEEAAAEGLWARLRSAVSDRVSGRAAGLMLSGGVDSSAIALVLSDLDAEAPVDATAFTWSFRSLSAGDETSTARWAAARSGLDLHEVPGDDAWPLRGQDPPQPDEDSPFLWPFRVLNDRTLDAAKNAGAQVVLTGDRGDYVVGDWIYGDGRRIEPPPPPAFVTPPVRQAATDLHAAGWASIDDPEGGLRRARIADWAGGQIAEMSTRAFRARGVEYADPWADVRVADFVAGLPPEWVNRPHEPKRILRRAMVHRGVSPGRFTSRSPGDLFEKGLRREETEKVRALWRDPMAGELGFVNPHELRDAFESYVTSGTLTFDIWKPIALELWLRRVHGKEAFS